MAVPKDPQNLGLSGLNLTDPSPDQGLVNKVFNSVSLGQTAEKKDDKQKYKYGQTPFVKKDKAIPAVETAKNKFAPNANLPTTASAEPGKNLASIIAKVDPSGKAQVFKDMVKKFAMIKMMMSIAGSSAGPGGSEPPPVMDESQKETLINILTEGFCVLSKTYGYSSMIATLNSALANESIKQLEPDYQEIITGAVAQLVQTVLLFGENNIPVKSYPPVVYGNKIPDPLLSSLANVPDLAIKTYYEVEDDPHPGYIEFLTNENKIIYVKRTTFDLPYVSAEEESFATAVISLVIDLTLPVELKKLTVGQLDEFLKKLKVTHEEESTNAVMGKNSSANLMNNLQSILGMTGGLMNSLLSSGTLKIPVLNMGVVGEAIGEFSKNMAFLDQMAGNLKSGLGMGAGLGGLGALGNLGQLSALAGNLNSLGVSLPSIAGAVGAGNLSGLISNFGAVGGIASAMGSVSSIVGQVTSSGINISSFATDVIGVAASTSVISNAMQLSGVASDAVSATSQLMKNIGIS